MVGSSSIEQCVLRVASEVAENLGQSVRPIVEALYKAQPLSDLLEHLTEKMREAIRAVQSSCNNLQVDFSCYLRQTISICIRENGRQSITRQNVAHRAFGYTGLINDRFCNASTVPPLTRMPGFSGI